jgi:tRNA-dihydrouridine synthase B
MARAAEFVENAVHPDFIDLNSGCPVAKVVGKNGGASLLKDIRLFRDMVRALVGAVSIPVSVKLRSGWQEHEWVDVEFARAAAECGAAAIVLHPRSKTMGFSGRSYWERIAVVKNAVGIPVIGNGDICTAKDGCDMFEQTGCDSVMIGRGAFGNPWLFSQIKLALRGEPVSLPSSSERVAAALDHVARYAQTYGEKKAAADLKKHVSWYLKGMDGASSLRTRIFLSTTTRELTAVLEELSV